MLRNTRHLLAALLLVILWGPTADAQLPPVLPGVEIPDLPVGEVLRQPSVVGETLTELRFLRIRALLQENRQVLEPDPRGQPVVRGQVLALGLGDEDLAEVLKRGYRLGGAADKEEMVGGEMFGIQVLEVPPGLSLRRALRKLRRLAPGATFDYNHVYLPGGMVAGDAASPVGARSRATQAAYTPDGGVDGLEGSPASGLLRAVSLAEPGSLRVGLVDGGVDAGHPVFRGGSLRTWGCQGRPASQEAGNSRAHGTAVASLLVGATDNFTGAAPGATLYAADIYCGDATGGNVFALAGALAWLAGEQVPVINLSLVGPPNAALERIVGQLVAQGHLLVAAVGNDGPSAPPLYPAAYAGVVGVTGVDARGRALLEALRGAQVDFAAPGAELAAAGPGVRYYTVRGTSFAAPLVAGLLARELASAGSSESALARLAAGARDAGSRGRDRTYGDGVLAESLRVPPDRVAAEAPLAY